MPAIFLYIALGSALGGCARYAVSMASLRWLGDAFPYGTLIINIAGSALIGWLFAVIGPGAAGPAAANLRQFLMTGFCGGFTTFSSFSLETMSLARSGHVARAAVYIAASVLLCVAGVWLGYSLGRSTR